MQVRTQTEPLLNDYVAWHGDFLDKKKSAILTLRQNSRAIWASVAGLGVVLVLAYYVTNNSSEAIASLSSQPSMEKASQPIGRPSSEIEALRAAISEQNATSQQMVAAIDALRSEQQELQKQIAAMQAARQSTGTTGSINSQPTKAFATKKASQDDARHVPYPPNPRRVPYPRLN